MTMAIEIFVFIDSQTISLRNINGFDLVFKLSKLVYLVTQFIVMNRMPLKHILDSHIRNR